MDFYQIKEKIEKDGSIIVYPDFKACHSKDLMIRGRSFYAIWDNEKQIWSTDEYDVQRLIDQDLEMYVKQHSKKWLGRNVTVKKMLYFSSNMWKIYRDFVKELSDNSHQLDEQLTFLNTEVKKTDYVSKRLSYPLEEGDISAYNEIIGTLYAPEEREKLEWAVGSIIAGDSRSIQKFLVLYGEMGSGKSTFLNIVQKLFEGYYTAFDAKALTSSSNVFSTEVFRSNPLIAIQHDGDLSRIEDNTRLNSIVSHEDMTMNEKYKPSYTSKTSAFLFVGTNKPVKITDAKSGIIRRLIDVIPTGEKIPTKKYHTLVAQVDFELGAIAFHCLKVYRELGKNYYSNYRPIEMMYQTDTFFNFVETNFHVFKEQDGVSLSQGYEMYKSYCDEALIDFKMPRHKFREELKSYFKTFSDITRIDGKQIRSYYSGFVTDKFSAKPKIKEENPIALNLDCTVSLLDDIWKNCPAQYANSNETPERYWSEVKTVLSEIDTKKVHYVKPPENHIVIDFDLKDQNGNKSVELNLNEANKWPATYAEFSKGGAGIHLHYIYSGDTQKLSSLYSDGIEIKTFSGNAAIRRKVSKCNNVPIAVINSGLPMKGEKMINLDSVQSEKGLRDLIERNLRKEIHPGTKPSIDFIDKILDDAYKSGLHYDVTDMRPRILVFASKSTHQADYCIKLVNKMKFSSEEASQSVELYSSEELAFFDVEVFPNLFVIVWKFRGKGKKKICMYNPTPAEVEELIKLKLIGYNCRRYDNHIVYARYIGYTNEQLFQLSQRLINESRNALFKEAYNLSYTDVYDFSSVKQSLKKFEIALGIHHDELGYPWDKPVPENLWHRVGEYCGYDVDATEATFDNQYEDFVARQILADLSGLTVNDTTQMHTAKIIFGDDNRPQDKFVYTDLSEMFPGYTFENGKSSYRGEDPSEGGYVYSEPGMYFGAALLDVISEHPNSAVNMNVFGPYTYKFKQLVDARVAIKHKEFDLASQMLDGKLAPYLTPDKVGESDKLAYALKIAINIVYGLTSAKFDNKFKDPRNKDNIIAKRGALFMIDLKHAVQEQGFTVAHIKTDSIKIPNATPEIIEFVMKFGKKYGYTFEHEATYSRLCLVNNAVYIARYDDKGIRTKGGKHANEWTATGAQFAQSYVFKTLFSHEPIEFSDLCETKTVNSYMYLDMNEELKQDEHNYHFVGKAGLFYPIKQGFGGGELVRFKDDKYYAVTGTKGYRWLESEMVTLLKKEDAIDKSYYEEFVREAIKDISKYGDFDKFLSSDVADNNPPWNMPCGSFDCANCQHKQRDEKGEYCNLGYDILPF